MESAELEAIFDEGERVEKYVWLKHRFNPRPICDAFRIEPKGFISVCQYCAATDREEGSSWVFPADIEWAHVSNQTYEHVMRDRLTHAETSQTLVRLFFADFLPPQLVKHYFYTSTRVGTEMFCYFVSENGMVFDSQRSRIPLKVLLNIENTSIASSAVSEHVSFEELMFNSVLTLFWEKNRA